MQLLWRKGGKEKGNTPFGERGEAVAMSWSEGVQGALQGFERQLFQTLRLHGLLLLLHLHHLSGAPGGRHPSPFYSLYPASDQCRITKP